MPMTAEAAVAARPTLRGLYAITPQTTDTGQLARHVAQALAGGVRLLQYRAKSADADRRRDQAIALLACCRNAGARLIVNDDVELALAIDADGVHVGRDDLRGGTLAAIRESLGPRRLLGVSCYDSLELAGAAVAAGADYVAFGSMFASATKPGAPPAALATLTAARRTFGVPVAAIGGITAENGGALVAAGADLLAVISDLFGAPDITGRARQYQILFA